MASRRGSVLLNTILQCKQRSSFLVAPVLRPYPRLPRNLQPAQAFRRHAHSIPKPPRPQPPVGQDGEAKPRKLSEPHYELTFTCAPCGSRSTHTVSKQGYHKGSVLITCPSCRNRHIISDHLNIFGDRKITVEDLMKERGQLVKRGTLGEDGDIEFWDDGSTTSRQNRENGHTTKELIEPEKDAHTQTETVLPNTPEQALHGAIAPPATATTTSTPAGSGTKRAQIGSGSLTDTDPSIRRQFHTQAAFRDRNDRQEFDLRALRRSMQSLGREDRHGGARPIEVPDEIKTKMDPTLNSSFHGNMDNKDTARDGFESPPTIPSTHLARLRGFINRTNLAPNGASGKRIPVMSPSRELAAAMRAQHVADQQVKGPDSYHWPLRAHTPSMNTTGSDQPRSTPKLYSRSPPLYDSNTITVFRKQVAPGEPYFHNLNSHTASTTTPTAVTARDSRPSHGPDSSDSISRNSSAVDQSSWNQVKRTPLELGHPPRRGGFRVPQGLKSKIGQEPIGPQSSHVSSVDVDTKFEGPPYTKNEKSGTPLIRSTPDFVKKLTPATLEDRERQRRKVTTQKVAYVWVDGAQKAVPVNVEAGGTGVSSSWKPTPGKRSKFRKVVSSPPEADAVDNAQAAEKARVDECNLVPQRPLPEEINEQIQHAFESARQLPPQQVTLPRTHLHI